MKIIKIILLIIVVSITSCGINNSSTDDLKTIDSLNTILANRESEIDNHLLLLDNIDSALQEANPTENLDVVDVEKVKAIDREIYDKIGALRDKLQADNREIASLRADLNKAKESADYRKDLINKISGRMEELQKENALLKQQLDRDTQDISNLTSELEAQGIEISQLRFSLSELNENIVILTTELNTVYYLVGTRKDVKRDSIIVKKGIGGAATFSDETDKSKFIRLDKSSDKVINLTGFKKLELVPLRPEDSYSLERDNDLIVRLKITDPDKFWETSKFLAIVVK
jgi:predicted RNase H-like nuclease (RuvC/YqgF family)